MIEIIGNSLRIEEENFYYAIPFLYVMGIHKTLSANGNIKEIYLITGRGENILIYSFRDFCQKDLIINYAVLKATIDYYRRKR